MNTRQAVEQWERRAAELLERRRNAQDFARYGNDLVAFAHEKLREVTWEFQDYLMRALMEHRRVTVRAGHKCSKTHSIANIVLGFMYGAPSIALTTGSGGRQVKESLWSRIRTQHGRAMLPGQCDTTAIRIAPDRYALGFSTDEPTSAQGFHAGVNPPGTDVSTSRLLVVIDEAPGVEQSVYDAMEGSLTGKNVYLLLAGNPVMAEDSPHFFPRSHRPGSGFHRIHVSLLPDIECAGADKCFHGVPDWLDTAEFVERMNKNHPGNSPMYRGRVLGEFSAMGPDETRVIPRALLLSAASRECRSEQGRHIGVDLARSESGDESVASLWVDGAMADIHTWRSADGMKSVNEIVAVRARWGGTEIAGYNIHVDADGLGGPIVDRLRQMGVYVDAVDFGGDPERDWQDLCGETLFKNRRAKLHWVFRRALEEGMAHVPERFTETWQQAQWPRYKFASEGSTGTRIVIEKKDDIKARHGRSPDHFDAALLAWSRSGDNVPSVAFVDRW